MTLSAYLVDDERHAITVLSGFIARTPGMEEAGCSVSPLVALRELSAGTPPDVLFLDVDMEELNGLDMVRMVPKDTRIVLTTSYREYGPEAYALDIADYLLKPVSYERFLQCVQKLRQERTGPVTAEVLQPFFVKTGSKGRLQKIDPATLFFAEAALNYVYLHTAQGKVSTYMSITELLEILPADSFVRVHKSFVVNLTLITAVEQNHIYFAGHPAVPVGRLYRDAFRAAISGRMVSGR